MAGRQLIKLLGSGLVGIAIAAVVVLLAHTATVTATPAVTATPTTEPPVFTATLGIMPQRDQLFVGQTLTVTVDITVSQGCQYPIFEMILAQTDGEEPILAHIEPPVDMITGPIQVPVAWTFSATQAGTATLSARTFGERYCGDYWNFRCLNGQSGPITITDPAHKLWLPAVVK